MARKFQVDNTIATDIKSAASDSFRENIRMIEIDKIKISMDNFYSMNDIEILADDIERQGLKHNLVVSEDSDNPDTYFIKSGHRRFAAIQNLISENRYGSKFVPCLVDGRKSKSENILDLIMLNATSRVMTDSELFKQYEVLKETIEHLKNEGIKVKGRLREKVAEMLNVSPAQIGKIENIKHNAVDEIKEAVESGDMSISTANSLAKLPEQEQKEILTNNDISTITAKEIKNHKEKIIPPQSDTTENIVSENDDTERNISDITDYISDDSDTYEYENQEELAEDDYDSEPESCTSYFPHWEEKLSEKENNNAETNSILFNEKVHNPDKENISDKTEMYRSKLLEVSEDFTELLKNALTVQAIREIIVDTINKITDIQMEVTNG